MTYMILEYKSKWILKQIYCDTCQCLNKTTPFPISYCTTSVVDGYKNKKKPYCNLSCHTLKKSFISSPRLCCYNKCESVECTHRKILAYIPDKQGQLQTSENTYMLHIIIVTCDILSWLILIGTSILLDCPRWAKLHHQALKYKILSIFFVLDYLKWYTYYWSIIQWFRLDERWLLRSAVTAKLQSMIFITFGTFELAPRSTLGV